MTYNQQAVPPLPLVPDADPGDPQSVLQIFLARYFRPGLVDSYIRTFVPAGLGWLISYLALNFRWLHLPNHPSAAFSTSVTLGAIAGYYFVARLVEKRWPKLGTWMVALNLVKTRPVYVQPKVAASVEAAAAVPAVLAGRHAAGDGGN